MAAPMLASGFAQEGPLQITPRNFGPGPLRIGVEKAAGGSGAELAGSGTSRRQSARTWARTPARPGREPPSHEAPVLGPLSPLLPGGSELA